MDPPSPPDVLSKSDVLSWITDRTSVGSGGGGGGSRESAFLEAVAEGNVRRLKKMVNRMDEKDRAKLTDMHIDGSGLMQVAANLGKIEVIRYLVEELGFDVNAGCLCGGATALGCAALFGEVNTVRYLLDCGADPNKIDETGHVALHCAVKNGHEEVAHLLLSSGSRVDIAVAHGTPLHIAVSFGKTGVVKILLDHHSDPNNTSGVWGTPILTALHSTKHGLDESDSLGCVKLLVKVHADPNIPDKQSGRTPIEIAASLRRRNHVEILFPFTSPVRAVTNWTVEGIITHGKSRFSMPKIKDEPCSKVNDRKIELKSLGGKAVKRKDYLGASRIYSEEHKKAFEVFLNALKLDPANADIEKVLWEALEAMKKDDAAEEKTLKSVD
uniref:Uncharacterized protein n=1 Tax=Oryza barthii TaxID=65489 RepID=A0A0D3FMF6_9ORYZ